MQLFFFYPCVALDSVFYGLLMVFEITMSCPVIGYMRQYVRKNT